MVTGGLTGAFTPSHLSALHWSSSEGTGGGGRAPGKTCRATSVRQEGRISAQGVHTKMQRCLFVPRRLPRNLSNWDANLLGTVGRGVQSVSSPHFLSLSQERGETLWKSRPFPQSVHLPGGQVCLRLMVGRRRERSLDRLSPGCWVLAGAFPQSLLLP